MLRSAMIQDYNVSVSTGKDKFTSSFVLGYFNQNGVLLNSDYQRISARANSTYRISDNLKLAFNLAPTYSFETDRHQMEHSLVGEVYLLTLH